MRDTTNTNQVKRRFLEERVNRSTQKKPIGAEKRTNKLNPHMTPDLGIESGPHWWEASALTTVPSLHPKSLTASASFKGQAYKLTTVKWTIFESAPCRNQSIILWVCKKHFWMELFVAFNLMFQPLQSMCTCSENQFMKTCFVFETIFFVMSFFTGCVCLDMWLSKMTRYVIMSHMKYVSVLLFFLFCWKCCKLFLPFCFIILYFMV